MVGAEPHRGVDRLDGTDAFVERVDRLVDHRQEDAVDDECGEVFGDGDRLVESRHIGLRRLESGVLRRDAADDLDQLHDRHRVHEVNADEAFRPIGLGRQAGDRDRRGVGRKQRLGIEHRAELGEDLALDRLVLGGRLDDHVGLGEPFHRLRCLDLRHRGLAHGIVHLSRRDLAGEVAADGGDPGLDPFG